MNVTNPASNGTLLIFQAQNTGALSSGDNANCPSSNFTWAQAPTISIPPITINGGETKEVSLDDVVLLDSTAPNECQGVDVNVPVRITARTP